MNTMTRPNWARKALSALFALAMSAALLALCGNVALAAEGPDSHASGTEAAGQLMVQGVVGTQDLTAATGAPTNSASMYEVYSTYLFFNPGLFYAADCRICMEIRPIGGEWSTYTNMMYLQSYTINGLIPNTKYETRLYYSHIWSGDTSDYSNVVAFKTGPKNRVAVKSVKVQSINVKKHWQKIYGYVIYLGKRAYYTYKLRTTVTLKKVPKEKYIWINGKRFKANKKTYTVTTKKLARYYKPPRGTRYTVSVYTGRNLTWKGYSPLYQKSCKVK